MPSPSPFGFSLPPRQGFLAVAFFGLFRVQTLCQSEFNLSHIRQLAGKLAEEFLSTTIVIVLILQIKRNF